MEVAGSSDYFQSYEDLDVHRIMLEDTARNKAYHQAIMDNSAALRGKIVLDVGAGTGVLSVFCAQAGAAKVYAVEASETYRIAEDIVKENGFESVIHVIHNKIEDVTLPGDIKVDAIVSEWMGFYLLHEGMLDSVLYARDKFLKPDGLMFPDSATLYAAPCSYPSMYDFWNSIEGVQMKSLGKKLRQQASRKPETSIVKMEHLLAVPEAFFWIDLRDVKRDELDAIRSRHIFVCSNPGKYQGICIWFTCTFPSHVTEPVILSTDPDDVPTHWKQTTVVLPEDAEVELGEPIAVALELIRSQESARRYNIQLTMLDANEVEHPEYCTCYMTKCILAKAVIQRYESNEM